MADINIPEVIKYHHTHGKIGTITMYIFSQNKGIVEVGEGGVISSFREKAEIDGNLINIGFMVLEPEIFNYIQ